jgi:hypothetical protein
MRTHEENKGSIADKARGISIVASVRSPLLCPFAEAIVPLLRAQAQSITACSVCRTYLAPQPSRCGVLALRHLGPDVQRRRSKESAGCCVLEYGRCELECGLL